MNPKDLIIILTGFRKLLLAGLSLSVICGLSLVVLAIFLYDWYLGTGVLSGDKIIELYIAAFKYSAAIAGSYMAANVCVKGIYKWANKRK